jgi:exopolysaccharide production protein ExoY
MRRRRQKFQVPQQLAAAKRRCGEVAETLFASLRRLAVMPIRPRPSGRRHTSLTTIQWRISFYCFALILSSGDSAGGRDQFLARICMSRVDASAHVATEGAQPEAIHSRVDVRDNSALRAPVGGHVKRATDIALAATALVLLAPVSLLIAALLHIGLGRPVFTAQQRIGFAGRRFTAYMFSTLPNVGVRSQAGQSPLARCAVNVLRGSGLDRLPELVSILRGDMSFVGPRPVQVGQPGPHRPHYFAARPGLIGVYPTYRFGPMEARGRAAMDRYYVRRWTIWLDLAVLARSLKEAS